MMGEGGGGGGGGAGTVIFHTILLYNIHLWLAPAGE